MRQTTILRRAGHRLSNMEPCDHGTLPDHPPVQERWKPDLRAAWFVLCTDDHMVAPLGDMSTVMRTSISPLAINDEIFILLTEFFA